MLRIRDSSNFRTIMSIFRAKSTNARTRERLFAEKYAWLYGRALRLVHGDHATAEDLVQDTFVRFILAETALKSTENIEPLLYTFLKFAHLAHLRRLQRYPSEPLPLAKYDFIELALRANASVSDRVEVQNTLRRIAAYACWRKETAKSASILIFRYFHGYYPEEIASVALTSRQSLDKQLHEGREEASMYASSSGQLRIIREPAPPELVVPYCSTPSDQLVPELRKTIFASCQTNCLSEEVLRKHYQMKTPIPRELLAHIVSCERCLDLASRLCGITPPTDRYLDETLGPDKQSRSRKKKEGPDIKRALRIANDRIRQTYEHEPEQLSIVVNGAVQATQDVSSSWNRQEVQLAPDIKPEFIEVISEQGVCLLALYVDSAVSEVQEEINHEVALSNGRQIRARVRFTTVGVLVQVAYYMPQIEAVAAVECEPLASEETQSTERDSKSGDTENAADPFFRLWLSRLWAKIPRLHLPEMSPALAAACILALLVVVAGGFWLKSRSDAAPNQILAHAVAANIEGTSSASPGVISQKVRIRTSKRTVERTIYRDAQGRRQLKAQTLSADDAQLQARLSTADVAWDNPLSAVNYKVWHDSGLITHDKVTRSGDGMLTLTTTADSGPVASESLTLREQDLHPVERTIAFRDADTIDIAEVDYSVLPWAPATDSIFEQLSANSRSGGSIVIPARPVSKGDLDDAELQARLLLSQLHLDTDDRIEVSRTALGIHIQGIVETDSQKKALEAGLARVPYVQTLIMTFQEMAASHARQQGSGGIIAASQDSTASPLEIFLKKKGMSSERIDEITWRLIHGAIVARSEGNEIATLTAQFGDGSALSDRAQSAFRQILSSHRARLLTSLQDEEDALAAIGFPVHSSTNHTSSNETTLTQAVLQNQHLCEALTKNGDEQNQDHTVALDIDGLRDSINQVQEALGRQTRNLGDTYRLAQKN